MPDETRPPWGSVHVRQELNAPGKSECSVYVGGEMVARLPVVKATWRWDGAKDSAAISYVELTLRAEDVAIDSHNLGGPIHG